MEADASSGQEEGAAAEPQEPDVDDPAAALGMIFEDITAEDLGKRED